MPLKDVERSVIDNGNVFAGTFTSMCKVCHSFFVSPCLITHVKFSTTTGTLFVKFDNGKLHDTLSISFRFCLKLDKSNGQNEDVNFCGKLQRA